MPMTPGDLAPYFTAPSKSNPRYNFASVAGRYVVVAFLPVSDDPSTAAALNALRGARALFDDASRCFFGIVREPEAFARAEEQLPGIRWLHDVEGEIARLWDVTVPQWIVLDPALRVIFTAPLAAGQQVMERLAQLPDINAHAGVALNAPVLIAPRLFEPELCRRLIDHYDTVGGRPSGFMREVNGQTVVAIDPNHKKRSDVTLEDETLKNQIRARIQRRLAPLIRQSFQFEPTRMERYIVACYDSESGGYFRPHRDNTTMGTAHRRFAVSINLNADEHEGGDLRFPEFGDRTYRPPTGGAVVFSCSLLHEATPVTAGKRYAFLPFLYDEAAARVREANSGYLEEGLRGYRAGTGDGPTGEAETAETS
jgi:peroxiredoxin